VHFFFLWLSSVDLALSRIRGRVSEGGHDVPEVDVRRRFDRSIKNFLVLYRALADSLERRLLLHWKNKANSV
jgi:predicted ABC-type ATPase